VRSLILTSTGALAPWVSQWDRLALTLSRPYCAPGWLVPWWEHMRPERSTLAVVLLYDGSELLAVAPFFRQASRLGGHKLRLLGSGTSHGMDILSLPSAATAAPLLVQALVGLRPALISFESIDARSFWPRHVQQCWPGTRDARLVTTGRRVFPEIALDRHGRWFEQRERKFRKEIARSRRRLMEVGGRTALALTTEDRRAALAAFERLHAARWSKRGGTSLLMHETAAMLRDAVARMPADRLRMWCTYVGREIIAVDICVAAGDTVSVWNGGFDEAHAKLGPGILTVVAAIEDAEERGEQHIELGGGGAPYKLRLAGAPVEAAITTHVVVPWGRGYPKARLALLPHVLKRDARRVLAQLPPSLRDRVHSPRRRR
jgi:CelD/BcsL family acetyltransferase involved in cellulose biosynthesis